MNITNTVALITGAGKGLGRSTVETLLEKGATVVAIDYDEAALKEIPHHEKLTIVAADLLKEEFFSETLPALFKQFKFNVLVNNAGILHNKPLVSFGKAGFSKISNEEWDLVLNINLKVPMMMAREVVEHMIKTRSKGVIINISSISAQGNLGQSAYSASKAGIESFTNVIAKELGAWGIRAACLAPGYMDTVSTHTVMQEETLGNIVKNVPLRRLGKTTEVANGICFIIENDFFNGKVLAIDGGLTI